MIAYKLKICSLAYSFWRSFKVTYHLWQKQILIHCYINKKKELRFKEKKRSVAFSIDEKFNFLTQLVAWSV